MSLILHLTSLIALTVVSRLLPMYWFPSLTTAIDHSVEFSTPITSYRSLKEGLFLLNSLQWKNVYNGGVVHHPILLLKLVNLFQCDTTLYFIVECLITIQFYFLTRILLEKVPKLKEQLPVWVPSLMYCINPISILSFISKSTIIFSNATLLSTLLLALHHNIIGCSIMLSLASYLSLYPTLLIIPILTFFKASKNKVKFVLITLINLQVLMIISFKLNGNNWNFINGTYTINLNFEKNYPNLGLWWYFFIEMFMEFVPFYKSVFNLFLASFIVPITLRFTSTSFDHFKTYAFILCLGWMNLTKPYPVMGDTGFWITCVLYFLPLSNYGNYFIISILLLIHSIILSPIFYYLWIELGSGNSNFFYAISLVYNLALGSIITDLVWGMLRFEYDDGVPNYDLKLTQI
ncbi:hypothetical protein KAFR_0B00330 [Kazachstania africana CBS 2517]|uniref:GPI transamidase component GAB1 n=1 Tax=Kazachstania africana (strain ATCC 22294 / BCRC 22015 / CBS 2517 / CECT 1963 / NBRC 1671 / NRRL Y-8276) TaxID=1071382 RepID=H2APN3_KAZAF|nr:hypothetical protein KAFR_0B00330 [Kazachstania africana CBS 2517]CCF56333.1 hypothetical protein KAFR_0B00330 [Kazachstania africana CBS 2517]